MDEQKLSSWWKNSIIITLIFGFSVLIWMSASAYKLSPPIPERVISQNGEIVFLKENIVNGQKVFLKKGLMENGTIWGHGSYLGPDFSAEYLHTLSVHIKNKISLSSFGQNYDLLQSNQKSFVDSQIKDILKENKYDKKSKTLEFINFETESFNLQIDKWTQYFKSPTNNFGLPKDFINNEAEIKDLVSFFAWTAWASVVNRPSKNYSYTNNFPYDPTVGNIPTSDAFLWSALSLVALLGGIAIVLFSFGKFAFLGWKESYEHIHPNLIPGKTTNSQKAIVKYFVIVILLFFVQSLLGGAVAHYRAEPGGFYGFDISSFLPSNIVRTWHLQLAIFWVATAYIGGGLFLAPALGGKDPKNQTLGVNLLFIALVIVVVGSMVGELLGINNLVGDKWFWIGHQGWEYLDLGRFWQILLATGLIFWLVLLFRGILPAIKDKKESEITSLFLYAAIAIPLFYLPAFFFDGNTHYSIVDTWRFWIIHLWVEGFFELFVTVMVAVIFYKLGIIRQITALRVVYLDAILYLAGGIIGTAHHWYWIGHPNSSMALGAIFSALEVVPLTLLTLDAWDFIKLSNSDCAVCGKKVPVPHKWTFYFLMAVGFWNFVGAGVFGFLINTPIISYFEVGTILTPNHGHAAMMGVFGMLALALAIFTFRQVLNDNAWKSIEKYIKISFWGLNLGLVLMVISNLFPAGILQLLDVINNGYWHARSPEFLNQNVIRMLEWARLPGDMVFIVFGCLPLVVASLLSYIHLRKQSES